MSDSQIDVLQAEVTALKTLVLTSTPSSPNRQLHPQLQSPGTRGAFKHGGGHIRNKSASGALPSSLGKPEPSSVSIQPVAKEEREVTWVKFADLTPFFLFGSLDHPSLWFLSLISLFFLSVLTSLTCCSSSQSLVSLPLSACCSCSPLSDTLPGPWPVCQGDI